MGSWSKGRRKIIVPKTFACCLNIIAISFSVFFAYKTIFLA